MEFLHQLFSSIASYFVSSISESMEMVSSKNATNLIDDNTSAEMDPVIENILTGIYISLPCLIAGIQLYQRFNAPAAAPVVPLLAAPPMRSGMA